MMVASFLVTGEKQDQSIPEEFNAGIRVLDLRVGWWTVNGSTDLYMCHVRNRVTSANAVIVNYRVSGGLLVSTCLGQIDSFLKSHHIARQMRRI